MKVPKDLREHIEILRKERDERNEAELNRARAVELRTVSLRQADILCKDFKTAAEYLGSDACDNKIATMSEVLVLCDIAKEHERKTRIELEDAEERRIELDERLVDTKVLGHKLEKGWQLLEGAKDVLVTKAKESFEHQKNLAEAYIKELATLLGVVQTEGFKQEHLNALEDLTGRTFETANVVIDNHIEEAEIVKPEELDLGQYMVMVEPNPVVTKVEVKEVTKVEVKEVTKVEPKEAVSADELMKVAKEAKVREELTVLLAELDVLLEDKRLEPSATRKKEIQKEITKLRSKINYRKKKLK